MLHLFVLCAVFLMLVYFYSLQIPTRRTISPISNNTPVAHVQADNKYRVAPYIPKVVVEKKPFDFLVIGDYGRSGSSAKRRTVDQMRKHCQTNTCNFLVSVGDNFYPKGVTDIHDAQWDKTFTSVFYDLPYPYFVVLGNHDYMTNPQAQAEYTQYKGLLAKNQESSTVAKWFLDSKRYYYVDIDNQQNMVPNSQNTTSDILARIIFLDTTPFRGTHHWEVRNGQIFPHEMRDTAPQVEWLQSVLSDSRPRWKIVIAHHPMFSFGNHGDCRDIHFLRPLFAKYHVHAMIYGHDHVLQYNQKDGIHYYLVGTGSDLQGQARAYPQYRNNEQAFDVPMFFDAEHNGFLHVHVEDAEIRTQIKSATGHVLHENVIK